jgi:hypothetical protein
VIPTFEFIKNIMENNNLIPIWDELPEIKKVLHMPVKGEENKNAKDELKMFEK